jgi:hypothetical protein
LANFTAFALPIATRALVLPLLPCDVFDFADVLFAARAFAFTPDLTGAAFFADAFFAGAFLAAAFFLTAALLFEAFFFTFDFAVDLFLTAFFFVAGIVFLWGVRALWRESVTELFSNHTLTF